MIPELCSSTTSPMFKWSNQYQNLELEQKILTSYFAALKKHKIIYHITMSMKKPSSWIVILYDIPPEPSRLKVRLWRDFKRMGAVYPFMSVCVVPYTNENSRELERICKLIVKNGKLLRIRGKAFNENDQGNILQIFRTERNKQYNEILEESHEFMDEIKLNINNKKTTQEEVEEMEESLNGLRRWFDRVRSIDWVKKSADADKVDKSLKKCEEMMAKFSHLSHPKPRIPEYKSESVKD